MKLINKRKFDKAELDKKFEIFIIYICFIGIEKSIITILIIKKSQITSLFIKKVKILAKYLGFSNVFIKEKDLMLLKIINLNQYAIKLQKG